MAESVVNLSVTDKFPTALHDLDLSIFDDVNDKFIGTSLLEYALNHTLMRVGKRKQSLCSHKQVLVIYENAIAKLITIREDTRVNGSDYLTLMLLIPSAEIVVLGIITPSFDLLDF